MSNQLTSKRSIITTRVILVFAVGLSLTIFISCGETNQTKTATITDSNKTQIVKKAKTATITDRNKPQVLSPDSLVKAIFKFAEPCFYIHTVDSIIDLKGKPQYTYRKVWGEGGIHSDSLLIVGYPLLEFSFLKRPGSHFNLQNINFLDNNVTLAGDIRIGKTTRQDILQRLGLPDSDGNDGGRTMTKSGDTTIYGKQSGAGGPVIFSYYINIDEYSIGFAMTNDTLREMTWTKNMN